MTAQVGFEAVPILTLARRVGRAIDNERRRLARRRGPAAARAAVLVPALASTLGYDDGVQSPSWSLVTTDGRVSTFWREAPSA